MSLSFEKFNYGLRPSKQVERKILIEKLLRLSQIGYPIRDYTYLGFGSVYFIDFVMFHKFLHIDQLVCVEGSSRKNRMTFNQPYACIKLELAKFSNVVSKIDKKQKYIVWLDYDYPVGEAMLQDIDNCVNRLAPGSIFLVTAEAKARIPENAPRAMEDESVEQQRKFLVDLYNKEFGALVDHDITLDDLDRQPIINLFWQALTHRITETLSSGRTRYFQLFNYVYADGAPMLTLGGMIGEEADGERLASEKFFDEEFIQSNHEPLEISVPPLTMREKYWLDRMVGTKLKAKDLPFEMKEEFLNNYRRFYKQYPTFVEIMV